MINEDFYNVTHLYKGVSKVAKVSKLRNEARVPCSIIYLFTNPLDHPPVVQDAFKTELNRNHWVDFKGENGARSCIKRIGCCQDRIKWAGEPGMLLIGVQFTFVIFIAF